MILDAVETQRLGGGQSLPEVQEAEGCRFAALLSSECCTSGLFGSVVFAAAPLKRRWARRPGNSS